MFLNCLRQEAALYSHETNLMTLPGGNKCIFSHQKQPNCGCIGPIGLYVDLHLLSEEIVNSRNNNNNNIYLP